MAILGPDGAALPPVPRPADAGTQNRRVIAMLTGGVGYMSRQPYDAAAFETQEMTGWHPFIASPDVENNLSRDRVVARIRDISRNDGWANGAITRIVDSVIGGDFRPVPKPDWRALAQRFPGVAFDAAWAKEYSAAAAAIWRDWAYSPGRYCDGARRLTAPQLFALAFTHEIRDGESLAVMLWLKDRMGHGRADYATALQLIDPDRLSNRNLEIDTPTQRGGVEIDRYGAAVGYWIRRAHPFEWWQGPKSYIWDMIPRETDFGRPVVIHTFHADRIGQHRPVGGVLTPVLNRLKMLVKYDHSELQAAVINAILAAYIESPYDPANIGDAIGSGDLSSYQADRATFHEERPVHLGGARLPTLFPGEKINMLQSARPSGQFDAFEHAMLRNVAAACGISAEQISNDWSRTNYSSARAAMMEAWKTMFRRRTEFAVSFAAPVFGCVMEEAQDRGELPLPDGAPEFLEARGAFGRARWMGAPRGWVDPVKEAQASVLRMDAGISTLEAECAEQGQDWEEVLAQRAVEVDAFKNYGLPLPDWSGGQPAAKTERPE